MTTSKILLSLLATFVVFIIAACGFPSPPNSTNSPGSPVPFDTFLQQVAQAKYSDYAQLPTTKVQNAQAFEEMRTYILNLYAGKQAISTYTINGQVFDCILAPNLGTIPGSNSAGGSQPPNDSSSAACPQGSIPMQRVTLERMVRFSTLKAFLGKSPGGGGGLPPVPSPGQNNK